MTSTDRTSTAEMPAARVEEFARVLRSEREELTAPGVVAESIEIDPTDDPGTRLAEHDAISTISSRQAAQLEQVDAALARIEAGTYGDCADCGATIPLERLEVVPSAAFCVQCQGRHIG